ncbi:MAG TPA: aspartyl protease family protein [Dyella sp.]|uniref:aspartyl protease family protein n=1 Tax=Dyella sp. TaxID=1869338 RepID=UPI002C4AE85E|nr:aspartyl protease family protein [Dyella sp.]HTV84670.1 aspartyl protease family protein [Dyella sp.]
MTTKMLRLCGLGICMLLAGQVWAGTCHLKKYGTLPVDMIGGQPTTMIKINGTDTRFMLDTGAFFNIMSKATAASLGLRLRPLPDWFRISGIGGSSDAQYTRVKDFGILGTTFNNVEFMVGGSDAGYGLLGANLLDALDLEVDLAQGKLTLFGTEGCGDAPLAYWAKDGNYNVADIQPLGDAADRRTILEVVINGKKLQAVLDSGAYATMLSRDAAERIGIDLNGPDAKASITSSGFGAKTVKTWTVNIDSFSIGTETVHHSQMQVLDGDFGDRDTDMLLGVDFMLAHHMYIANEQHKVYFSYNGGRVFTLAAAPSDNGNADTGTSSGGKGTTPKSASDYALAGEAHLSRGEPKAAVADLNEAIRLAPDQAAYYLARARANAADKQPDAELADLDKAISLDPKNVDALLARAEFRLARKDSTGAAADVATAAPLVAAGSAQARATATLYVALQQPAAALPLLDDWIKLHQNDAMLGDALNERCWARALSNQMLDDALKDCRKAIRRDGKNPAYLDSMGMVQLRLGRYADAIKAYQQALALNPLLAWSHYGLGLAEIRSGQADAGNAQLAAARAINPHIEALAQKHGLTTATP